MWEARVPSTSGLTSMKTLSGCGTTGRANPCSSSACRRFSAQERCGDSTPSSAYRAGDYIAFQAHMDCLVVLSSCPMEIVPISAGGITPLELQVGQEP